jgi:hypothetical protein
MAVQIINANKNDTLIFKFNDKELTRDDLNNISETFRNITGCSIIILDNQCNLETVIDYE